MPDAPEPPTGEEQPPIQEQPPSRHEQPILELLLQARTTVRAPQRLRASIEAQRPSRAARPRIRAGYASALAGAVAAAAIALTLILPAGSPGGPSVSQAASLALKGSQAPPPPPDTTSPQLKLRREVEDVYFPNWSSRFGWRAVGQRLDRLDDHRAVTVYYQRGGVRVAYTIVSAPPLAAPAGHVSWLSGTELRTLMLGGRQTVTWHRNGHTCVLSGKNVSAAALEELAAWKAPGEGR